MNVRMHNAMYVFDKYYADALNDLFNDFRAYPPSRKDLFLKGLINGLIDTHHKWVLIYL